MHALSILGFLALLVDSGHNSPDDTDSERDDQEIGDR